MNATSLKGDAFRLLLGVTGSISAYRAADLVSALTKEGVEVDVILTREAQRFITPLTLQTVAHRPVYTDATQDGVDGKPSHIALADAADLILVAPASANLIGLLAHGLAPDLLSSTLLAASSPVWIAPAMNGHMWSHPAVQANVRLLEERGVRLMGPDSGMLACGYEGQGRLLPVDDLLVAVRSYMGSISTA